MVTATWLRAAGAAIALSAMTLDAQAQNLDAGKSAGQLFSGNCAACHRSSKGLSKTSNVGQVAGFLRQHYTTNREMAGTLAAFVVGAGVDPSGRRAREAASDSAKPSAQRQAARGPDGAPVPTNEANKPELTREERLAARRAKAEAAAKRDEKIAAQRVGLTGGVSDPDPVQISSAPIALTHDRATSRSDLSKIYTPAGQPAPEPAQAALAPATVEQPAAGVETSVGEVRPPVETAPPAAMSVETESPAASATGPVPVIGETATIQPFAAPLP